MGVTHIHLYEGKVRCWGLPITVNSRNSINLRHSRFMMQDKHLNFLLPGLSGLVTNDNPLSLLRWVSLLLQWAGLDICAQEDQRRGGARGEDDSEAEVIRPLTWWAWYVLELFQWTAAQKPLLGNTGRKKPSSSTCCSPSITGFPTSTPHSRLLGRT